MSPRAVLLLLLALPELGTYAREMRLPIAEGPVKAISIREPSADAPPMLLAELDLERVRPQLVEQITPLLNAQIPFAHDVVTWGNFRFRDFRVSIRDISFLPGASPDVRFQVTFEMWATRERLVLHFQGIRSGVRWDPDGSKNVSTATAAGSLHLIAGPSISFDARVHQVDGTIHLAPLDGVHYHLQVERQLFAGQVPIGGGGSFTFVNCMVTPRSSTVVTTTEVHLAADILCR